MQFALDEPDIPVEWTAKFREIGINVLDGKGGTVGESNILIAFCPWCGNKLPESLRDEWFSELERRNIDPYGDNIPDIFLDGRWYENLQK
jgi:hypothetical protein